MRCTQTLLRAPEPQAVRAVTRDLAKGRPIAENLSQSEGYGKTDVSGRVRASNVEECVFSARINENEPVFRSEIQVSLTSAISDGLLHGMRCQPVGILDDNPIFPPARIMTRAIVLPSGRLTACSSHGNASQPEMARIIPSSPM
jgi:hypothetical protein